MGNEDLYLRAVEELERGLSPVLWRQLKEAAGWDEHGARALYVKKRVQELRREREDSLETEQAGLKSLYGSQRRARVAELLGEMADLLKLMEDQTRAARVAWGRGGAASAVLALVGVYIGGGAQAWIGAIDVLTLPLVAVVLAGGGFAVGSVVGGWTYSLSRRRRVLAERLTELDRTVHALRSTTSD